MTYVITDACIGVKDASCVNVCPASCIHSTPDSPQFYIDPEVCIVCEQCVLVCPVSAIYLNVDVPEALRPSIERNAEFFRRTKAPRAEIGEERALAMARAAFAHAERTGARIAVAIVDVDGVPVHTARMDGAEPWDLDLAQAKAAATALFQLPTARMTDLGKRPWFHSLSVAKGGLLVAGGAVPVLDGPLVMGAIAVSGTGTADDDVLCCRAGMGTL